MEERPNLDAGREAELDASYRPIRTFEEWREPAIGTRGWTSAVEDLTRAREAASTSDFRSLVEEAFRQASIDTGAIEGLYETDRGFTMTVAAMAATWEAAIEQEKGLDVVNLVTSHLEGYEMALDAATSAAPITEVWLRELQAVICAGQADYEVITAAGRQHVPLPKGEYKHHANHVLQPDGSTHAYAPVDETAMEVRRLVEEMRGSSFALAHPAEQAAYAHHALTAIHPFADGNGRTARALASVFLLRSVSLPLVVFADQRLSYLESLRSTDHGASGRFVEFVLDRAVDTILLVAEKLSGLAFDPTSSVAELDRLHRLPNGVTYAELHTAAERLLAIASDQLKTEAESLELTPGVSFSTGGTSSYLPAPAPEGWSHPPNIGMWPTISIQSAIRPSIHVSTTFEVLVSDHDDFGIALHRNGSGRLLRLRVGDVHPLLSSAASERVRLWARREISVLLSDLVAQT